MICRDYEPLIALYVEGDLDDAVEVERHLTECVVCRELLEDLEASQAALKELAQELVDPALLREVRSGVLGRIGEKRWMVWPWVAALAAGAALFVLLIPAPPKPCPIATNPPNPPMAGIAHAVERQARTPVPHKRKKAVKTEPLVVKMLTSDPDVVIIWLVDRTGD